MQIATIRELDLKSFLADKGMRKIDGVGNRITVGGINGNKFIALAHFELAKNLHVLSRAALLADTGLVDEINEGLGAAVKDGELKVVEFHEGIVDAEPGECGKQVFGGGDQNTFFHQAGGVADAGDVAAGGFNLKAVQISAAEDDTGARRRRQNAHVDFRAAVQSYSTACDGRADCLLLDQLGAELGRNDAIDYNRINICDCGKKATLLEAAVGWRRRADFLMVLFLSAF